MTVTRWKIFGGVMILVMVPLLWGSLQATSPDNVGQHSLLRVAGGGEVPVAATEAGFEALSHAAVANDRIGLAQLMLAGTAWSVPSGTQVLVIDMGMGRRQIRFEGGDLIGQTAWVSSDHIAAQ